MEDDVSHAVRDELDHIWEHLTDLEGGTLKDLRGTEDTEPDTSETEVPDEDEE